MVHTHVDGNRFMLLNEDGALEVFSNHGAAISFPPTASLVKMVTTWHTTDHETAMLDLQQHLRETK